MSAEKNASPSTPSEPPSPAPAGRPSARNIAGLVGSYAWALGMVALGSVLGGVVSMLVGTLAYVALVPGAGVEDFAVAMLDGPGSFLDTAGAYSASAVSALYTGVSYLSPIGLWIVALAYLATSRRARPILKTVTRQVAGNTPARLGAGVLLGLTLNAACGLVAVATGSLSLSLVGVNVVGLVFVFLCVFVQSSSEELLCRCYLYQRTLRVSGSHVVTIAVTSLLFGALHLGNAGVTVLSIANVTLIGVLFGLMTWRLDSPWAAFGAHTGWNFMQAVVLGLPNSGIVTPFALFGLAPGTGTVAGVAYDPAFGIEGSPLATALIVVACVCVYLWGERHAVRPTDVWAGFEEVASRGGGASPLPPTSA
jgi:membrane protease YdiL (CAAX protease family)